MIPLQNGVTLSVQVVVTVTVRVVGHSGYEYAAHAKAGGPIATTLQFSKASTTLTGHSHEAAVLLGEGLRVAVMAGTRP